MFAICLPGAGSLPVVPGKFRYERDRLGTGGTSRLHHGTSPGEYSRPLHVVEAFHWILAATLQDPQIDIFQSGAEEVIVRLPIVAERRTYGGSDQT